MKSILLFIAIAIGLLCPQLAVFSDYIRITVMIMLVQGFLVVKLNKDMFSKEVLYVLLANLIIPIPVFLLVRFIGDRQAEAAFLIAAAPAAVASPIVIEFIKKRTDFVALAIVATNIATVVTLPIAIPLISEPRDVGETESEYAIILSVITTILIPLAIAMGIRIVGGKLLRSAVWTKKFTVYIWLSAIILACAKARNFVQENEVPHDMFISMFIISGILCFINFGLGYILGGKKFARESSQSLGQKNTMFAVWVGLTFLNPISVIAPVAYIIFQNIYNASQIFVFEWQEKRKVK